MSDDTGHRLSRSELRHAINNHLNTLSIHAELAAHHLDRENFTSAREALQRIVSDCRRISKELSRALGD